MVASEEGMEPIISWPKKFNSVRAVREPKAVGNLWVDRVVDRWVGEGLIGRVERRY